MSVKYFSEASIGRDIVVSIDKMLYNFERILLGCNILLVSSARVVEGNSLFNMLILDLRTDFNCRY